jgi:hypothetical protein
MLKNLIYILYYYEEEYENYDESIKKRRLDKDGFCVLYDQKYSINSIKYPCNKLVDDVLSILPPGYNL